MKYIFAITSMHFNCLFENSDGEYLPFVPDELLV